MNKSAAQKISPNKKFYAQKNGVFLEVVSRENGHKTSRLALNKFDLTRPSIFRWSPDSEAIGMIINIGIPFDAGGWMSSRKEVWVGLWYPFREEFYSVHFTDAAELESNGNPVDSIEVNPAEKEVICSAQGTKIKSVKMPPEQTLSNWQKEKLVLVESKIETAKPDKKEWTWNQDENGYEGVNLYSDEVLWFIHTHNPHAGGAARNQSFEDFLTNGPACSIPGEFLPELFETVKKLAKNR